MITLSLMPLTRRLPNLWMGANHVKSASPPSPLAL